MKTLIEKTILVRLRIAQWSARKYDRKVTQEVNEKHDSTDAGRFNKILIATKHLQAISAIAGEARDYHYKQTLPWGDDGYRMLSAMNYFDYTTKIDGFKQRFSLAVSEFCENYPSMIEEARTSLKGLFIEADYPQRVDDKFEMTTMFMPVPNAADLRVDLNTEDVKYLRDEITKDVNEKYLSAQRDVFNRVAEHLKHMHSKLSDKKAVFRDSLFENLLELTDLLPKLNIGSDNRIDELCADLKKLYAHPDSIRKNSYARGLKADAVQDVMSKVDSFMQ